MSANDISIVLAWIAVAAVVARLTAAWPQLPARPAIHFNYRGQADGWTSRRDFGLSAVLLMIGPALASAIVRLVSPEWAQAWILSAVAIVVATAIWRAIEFNLGKQPFALRWVMLPALLTLALAWISRH